MAYASSAMVNGFTFTTLAEVGKWASCAGYALLVAKQGEASRTNTLRAIAWFGVVTAAVAYCVAIGLLRIDGGLDATRLDFTFQYANATGVWFGVCTLLCLLGKEYKLRRLAVLPVAGMLLTQSAGVAIAFALVSVLAGTMLARAKRWRELALSLWQGVLGVGLFVVARTLPPALSLAMLVAVVVAGMALNTEPAQQATQGLWTYVSARITVHVAVAALMVVLAGSSIGTIVLMQQRAASAFYGGAERICQIVDGLHLWQTSPLFGVGPNNWQFLYPYIQTAPYDVSVVHSSPVKLLDDAGIVGLVLFAIACVLGVRALIARRRDGDKDADAEIMAVALLLVHALVDFDLAFGALSFLLALMLCGPDDASTSATVIPCAHGLVAGLSALLVCVPLALCGLAFSASAEMLSRASAAQDNVQVVRRFTANPLAHDDPIAQEAYVAARLALGDAQEVLDAYEHMATPTNPSTLCAAVALDSLGQREEAALLLMDAIEQRPYDATLVEVAERFAQSFGIDASVKDAFRESLSDAQNRIRESWLTGSKEGLG